VVTWFNPSETIVFMMYESNPKHRDPWQAGRKGSLCPSDLTVELAQQLLNKSEIDGKCRWMTFDGRAFCGEEHRPGYWHGYPVGWVEVPEKIRRRWQAAELVTRRQINDYWLSSEDD
jgi:hypothetical protein